MVILQSGKYDWLWQRASALVMLVYFPVLIGCGVMMDVPTQLDWQRLIFHPVMWLLGVTAVVMMTIHAIIGSWVVATDYFQTPLSKRVFLMVMAASIWPASVLAIWAYFAAGLQWG